MVNLSTPSEQIIKELQEDYKKCGYWLQKAYHGEKGFERMRKALRYKCVVEGKNQKSDIVDYTSKNGNRWLVYEYATYYEDAKVVSTNMVAVCYYETVGSVGAFMIGYADSDISHKYPIVIIFTSHFFERFCERLGIEMRSKWMVQRFCEVIPGYTIKFKPDGKVDMRLPASVGRGVVRDGGMVIEIRTFLPDKMMTKKQLKETEQVREKGDKATYEPYDVFLTRIKKLSFDEQCDAFQSKVDEFMDMGLPEEIVTINVVFSVFIADYAIKEGFISPDDAGRISAISERVLGALTEKMFSYYDNGIDGKELAHSFCEQIAKEFKTNVNDVLNQFYEYLKDTVKR